MLRSMDRRRLAFRIARTTLLVLVLASGVRWAVPRFLPRLVGDTVFLREEFIHPAKYEAGGLTIAGHTFFARTADCTALTRERAVSGRNLLAGPALDDPCGWTFVPHLGDKEERDRSASGGRCFRLRRAEEQIYQDIPLEALAPSVDRGEVEIDLAGRLRSAGGALPDLVAEAFQGSDGDRTVLGTLVVRPSSPSQSWQPLSGRFLLPPGTRGLRVILRRSQGRGAVFFDDVSAVPLRSFIAPGL
jgi:hypothetical protein